MYNKVHNLKLYALYIGGVFLVMAIGAFVQITFVTGVFIPKNLVIPSVFTLFLGTMLAKIHVLKQERERQGLLFRAVADLATEMSIVRDLKGAFLYVSPAALEMTGYPASDFTDSPDKLDALIHPDDLPVWHAHINDAMQRQQVTKAEVRLTHMDGSEVWLENRCSQITDNYGEVIGVRSTSIDITGRKQFESRIAYLADYDELTALPNRRYMRRYAEALIEKSSTEAQSFALMFIDLDRFKNINDLYGHTLGDRFLENLSIRLKADRPGQALLSRFGGDEFVMILPHAVDQKSIVDCALQVMRVIEEPVEMRGLQLQVSASIGISRYPEDGGSVEDLLKHADIALYKAKSVPERAYEFFSSDLKDRTIEHVEIEKELRQAIKEKSFEVYYQPLVDMKTMRLEGMECLVRWRRDGQLVAPDNFIPIAEETDLISGIGAIVVEKACQQLRQWIDKGIDIKLAINISPRQLLDENFCQELNTIVDKYMITHEHIELEITECMLLDQHDVVTDNFSDIRADGYSLSIDDFGTGYSSLSYLGMLPANTLKIDQSFIVNKQLTDRDLSMVRAIIDLGHNFSMQLIVEGIEHKSQLDAVRDLGCDMAQGYYISRPMPASDIEEKLIITERGIFLSRPQGENQPSLSVISPS